MVGHHVERCPSCDAELPVGASFCPGCGEPTGVLAIDEEAPAEEPLTSGVEVVFRSGWRRVAGVVAALALVAGAAWLVGRVGGSERAAEVSVPTTTATTAPPATTTAARPTTTVATTRCESLPATTTAVLPEAAGVTLVLADREGLLRLDLATGTLSCGPSGLSRYDGPWNLERAGMGTLLTSDAQWYMTDAMYAPDEPAARIRRLDDGAYYPGPDPGTLWMVEWGDAGTRAQVIDVTQSPWQQRGEFVWAAGAWAVGVDGDRQLLLESVGGFYTLSVDGSIERVWEGRGLVAANPRTIVGVVCDDRLECRWLAEDRASGRRTDLGEAPLVLVEREGDFGDAALSPDGTMLAVPLPEDPERDPSGDISTALAVVDLRSGEVNRLSTDIHGLRSHVTWSADSRFLFWVDPDGAVQAWQRDGPVEPVPLGEGELPRINGLTTTG